MIQSMTGFATTTFILTRDNEKSTITMNLKTLNTRFFETTCKFPVALFHLETKIIKHLKKRLHRGHIYFTIYVSNPSIFQRTIDPALSTIKEYANAINQIKKELSITEPLSLKDLLHLPNIFNIEEKGVDKESEKLILDTIDNLINQVIVARTQEGKTVAQDVNKRIKLIKQNMAVIEKLAKQMLEQQKIKVHTILQEIGTDENALAEAQKNALYTTLDKIDIHEEIIRFKSHLHNLAQVITTDEIEKGKRLDFTLQELGREINTITAKCSDAKISTHAINIKVEIEKIREQIQNIV